MAGTYDFTFCAAPEIGMAAQDIPNAVRSFADSSNFPSVPDQLQQAVLDELLLGRLMTHPRRIRLRPGLPRWGRPTAHRVSGHAGGRREQPGRHPWGALLAIATDIPRGVLAVPGMDYALLIDSGVDTICVVVDVCEGVPDLGVNP
jgi:hypothetical protein